MLIEKYGNVENASKKVEERYKVKLPSCYAKFLDRYNGGYTHKTTIECGEYEDTVTSFYGIGEVAGANNFELLEKNYWMEKFLKKQLFPIANNIFGDFFVMSLTESNYGKIYIYYHDLPGKKLICKSFREFIENTKSEGIGHIPTVEEREKIAIEHGYGYKIEKLRPAWKKEIERLSKVVEEEVILED